MDKDKLVKPEPLYCDGVHHRWSFTAPLRCLNCDQALADTSDLIRAAAFRSHAQKEG